MLEQKVKERLKLENQANRNQISDNLVKEVIAKILKALTRKQFETFFGSEENIQKMKDKSYPLSEVSSRYRSLNISYYAMVAPVEYLFDQERGTESLNIAHLALDSLLQLNVDNRILAAQNLILTGGLFLIPGMSQRLLEELKYAVENVDKYKELCGLKDKFRIESWTYPPNIIHWTGASLLSWLNEEIDLFLISKKEFIEEENSQLPDRFGHWFVTCSRKTEVEDEEIEDEKTEKYPDEKYTVPETKRPLNYFNKKFEEINNKRKELLYSSATPYSTRGLGRPGGFSFPK